MRLGVDRTGSGSSQPLTSCLKTRSAASAVKYYDAYRGGCPESRGHCEDWSRLRAVGLGAAAPQLRTVESKEWRQEDTGRRYPQGLEGAKVVGV